MHAVITGGMGFIGSSIAARLLQEKHRVTLIDNLTTSVAANVAGADFIELDLLDDVAAEKISLPDADCLLHLAGPSSGMAAAKDPVGTNSRGFQITFNALVLAERLKVKRVVNASSMVVYGNFPVERNPVKETAPCLPISYYGVGKFATERLVEIFCAERGIGYNQLRMFNVYGPGQDLGRMDQGVVSIFLAMLLKSPKIVSKGPVERFRDIVHIDDVVTAWVQCATGSTTEGPLNVGSGEAVTYGDLMRLLADELGIADRLEIEVAEGTPGDQFGICADISHANAALGYVPRYTPEAGVRQFTRWALNNAT